MLTKPLLSRILQNDALTRGLGDAEARILVEWLVERVECVAAEEDGETVLSARIESLYQRGRAIGRFVCLWSQPRSQGAAVQLAGAERFAWPLPSPAADPCEVMQEILLWETEHAA
jgi:hypothetical protein